MKQITWLCGLLIALLSACAVELRGESLELTAAQLWPRAQSRNLRLSADGKSIELIRGLLIENDGDAAGYSYKPNEEVLGDGTTAIKWLTIPDSLKEFAKAKAYLLVGHTGKSLQLELNGKAVSLGEPQKAGNYWKRYEIPSDKLIAGRNEFRLTGDGKLWIARSDERSSTSREPQEQQSAKLKKGSDKQSKMLGPKEDIAGEYYVRLYLDGYFQNGSLLLPLMPITNLTQLTTPPADVDIGHLRVGVPGDWRGKDPTIRILTPISRENRIVAWAIDKAVSDRMYMFAHNPLTGKVNFLPKNFMVEIEFPASHAEKSPALHSLRISTRIDLVDSAKDKHKIAEQHNPIAAQPAFKFEPLDHPRLAHFRKQYALDDVVKGCTTDLQRMEKLAVWTSQQWTKGHLKDIYPKWDALEILKQHDDGTPIGGFCQQFNIVFLQACESSGMPGRCVSIGAGDHGVKIRSGHEVVEIWSNELNKWVYVDGQAAWYFVDKETREPLNLLELRERQIAAFHDQPGRAIEVVVLAKSAYEWKGLKDWPAFTELRMIPHTQFLDGKLPLPLNQGMRGWFWTGHRVWTDDEYPASVLYSDRVTNASNWNFPINQTQLWLQQREKAGELDVRLAHNMPSFDHFVAHFDDDTKEKQIDGDKLTWPLRAGENKLQVRAVNKLGIRGPASYVKLEYKP